MGTKIKISELFWSLQGEGQYIGVPSIFLRTFGCNFTCSGFAMPKGKLSTERDIVAYNINDYKEYSSLPLVSTGCDSYASWDPRFKHLSPMLSISEIVDKMQELLPDGKFSRDKHLIITGGEPLLGWQRAYPDLLNEIYSRNMGLTHLTFETNGTQTLSDNFKDYLIQISSSKNLEVTFSISAKLPCSGEKWDDAICPMVVREYLDILNHKSYFKFVVSTLEDLMYVKKAVECYRQAGIDIPIYLMPVGGVNSVYEMNERQVADYCKDNGLRFSPRIQVPLYKNQWGT
jgi:7-carboxy-7-deazaguanine synthase